jgi:phospholipid/cholesterol/gamma-HCH transport system substrate-binding protein
MNKRNVGPEAMVGLLVLVGVVLLFYMSFRVTQLERVKGEVYTAIFSSVSGLAVNAQVEVAGVPVGRIEKIDLEAGKAKVWMRIGKVAIHDDALAIIRTSGVLGDKYIQVKPGSPDMPVVPPGGMITRVQSAPDLDQVFAALQTAAEDFGALGRSIQELIGEGDGAQQIRELIANLNETSQGIKELVTTNRDKVTAMVGNFENFSSRLGPLAEKAERTVTNLEAITAKVQAGEGTMGKFLADETLYTEVKDTVASVRRVMTNVEQGEGSLGKLLTDESLYADAKETVASMRRVMARVEQGEGSLGKLLTDDTLYDEATKTMKKVQRASEGIEEQYPVTAIAALLGLVL